MILLAKEKYEVIAAAIKNRVPIMMIGETGVGKTTIAAAIAKSQKHKLVRLSLNGNIGTEELIGKFTLDGGSTKWVDGALVEAMRKGHWVVLDELNSALPEVLFALHALLDHERAIVIQEKDNERVKAHSDFRLFATINPVSYAGTRNLNAAFMSRFIIVNIEPLEPMQEMKHLSEKFKADQKVLDLLINLGADLRQKKKEGLIEYFCSTRDLEMAAELTVQGIKPKQAVLYTIINKMSKDDIDTLSEDKKTINAYIDAVQVMPLAEQIKKFESTKAEAEKAKRDEVVAKDSVKKLGLDITSKQTELLAIQKSIELTKKELENYGKLRDDERAGIAREYIQKHLS